MNVTFACPECERLARLELTESALWQCPGCDHRLSMDKANASLPTCLVCSNHELYKKKDFPHGLGMGILVVACVVSFVTYGMYEKWLTWAILIGSALFDGLLYLWVGDAVVCYRCHSHYRGFEAGAAHKPFELTIGERYRQEAIRRNLLK